MIKNKSNLLHQYQESDLYSISRAHSYCKLPRVARLVVTSVYILVSQIYWSATSSGAYEPKGLMGVCEGTDLLSLRMLVREQSYPKINHDNVESDDFLTRPSSSGQRTSWGCDEEWGHRTFDRAHSGRL